MTPNVKPDFDKKIDFSKLEKLGFEVEEDPSARYSDNPDHWVQRFVVSKREGRTSFIVACSDADHGAFELLNSALVMHKFQEKEIENLKRWISVNDRLPEGDMKKGVKVLAFSPTTIGQTTAWYHGPEIGQTPHPATKGWSLMGVTHWQSLPEDPKS